MVLLTIMSDYQYQVKKNSKKATKTFIFIFKCHKAASSTYQPSAASCSTRATQKSLTVNNNNKRTKKGDCFDERQENGPLA